MYTCGTDEKKLFNVPKIWTEVDMCMKLSRASRGESGRESGRGDGGGGEGGRIL